MTNCINSIVNVLLKVCALITGVCGGEEKSGVVLEVNEPWVIVVNAISVGSQATLPGNAVQAEEQV